jgi:uncharacterized membrane protein YgcG
MLLAVPRGIPTPHKRSRPARPAIVGRGILPLVLVGLVLVGSPGRAGAAVLGFGMSPASGPAGTIVQVSGTGCAPAITLSPTEDHVKVSSTTLALSTDIAVAANGSWHGTFAVPANAPALPGLVTALCFTNGLPSLTTIYTPRTFTVTGPLLPTTPVTTPTVPTTPTTETAQHTTTTTTGSFVTPTTPGATTVTPGTGPGATGGGPGRGGGGRPGAGNVGGGGPTGGGGNSHSVPGRGTSGSSPAVDGRAATAAALENPELASSNTGPGHSSSAWIFWLVLLALVIGAGLLLRWWHGREPLDAVATDAATDVS